jgi:hypothetical protein
VLDDGTPSDPASLEIEACELDDESTERFTEAVRATVQVFSGFARGYGVALPEFKIVGTLDFQGTVDALLKQIRGPDQADFAVERLGGVAIGKNVPLTEDETKVAIVMLAHFWGAAAGPQGLAGGYYFLGHELTHALLGRLRRESGALEGVTFPSQTPVAAARSMIRIAVDETRADMVAGIVLSHSATKTVNGQETRLRITDPEMAGPTLYRDRLAELLTTVVYPGWPNLVNRYRNWGCTLEELIQRLIQETDQVMTTVGHAEGERQATPDNLELFLPPAQGQPGADWLIGPAWSAIMDVVLRHPLVPSVADFRAVELAILDVGERELLAMWDRIGVSFDPPRCRRHLSMAMSGAGTAGLVGNGVL